MRYFAYGSNMNIADMRKRCPDSTHIGSYKLDGFRLVFNFYADIIPAEGCIVHGGLWNIARDDERHLDRYEGYPKLYGKYYYSDEVMYYAMKPEFRDLETPDLWYLICVIQGYKDFGLTQADFEESLGVEQLGLTPTDLEKILGVTTDDLEYLFSEVTPSPTD